MESPTAASAAASAATFTGNGAVARRRIVSDSRTRDDGAKTKARKSCRFGKRSRHEELRVLVDPWNDRDPGKLGIGFIDNDGRVGGGFQNCFDDGFVEERASWIVRVAEKQDARAQSEQPWSTPSSGNSIVGP